MAVFLSFTFGLLLSLRVDNCVQLWDCLFVYLFVMFILAFRGQLGSLKAAHNK